MARDFNGTSDKIVSSTTAMNVSDNWTLAAWINIEALPTTGSGNSAFDMVVYNGHDGTGLPTPDTGYGFGVGLPGNTGSKLIGLYGGISWMESAHTFAAADTWVHVVMRRSGTMLRYFINGAQDTFGDTRNPTAPGTGASFTIGAQDRDTEGVIWFFDGRIAEVAAWDRAVSDAEITSLSKGFSPLFFTRNLQAYYPLIGNTSPEVDWKNGKTATVTGTTAYPHPRIYYPSSYNIAPFAAGGAAATTRRYSLPTLGMG